MSAFDGTGPLGQGAMTGRGWGYCLKPSERAQNTRRGCMFGRGRGHRYQKDVQVGNLLTMIEELQKQIAVLSEQDDRSNSQDD